MKTKNYYIHIKLFDMWAREYQVLKNRTHPMMYMPSHSGYLLTAIKV
jgi:tRNA A58 N-methylase Trm61